MQDEQSLIQRAKQGDNEAFARVYEENFDKIYRYLAFRLGDETEAEDMTQQVFLKAFQSISCFNWRGISFSAWLFRIAHNQMIDHLRKKTKRPTVPLDEWQARCDDDPGLAVELKLDIEQMVGATEKLTKAQREVIALRFAGGLSVAEVAKAMGKSPGAVKALQHSAIVALRRLLLPG